MAEMEDMEHPLNPLVEFPDMRRRIRGAVRALADPEYQKRVWIRREYPYPGYYDDLDESVHALFDDTDAGRDPEGSVGYYMFSTEVPAMRALAAAFEDIIDDLGDVSDAEYLSDPRWSKVVELAKPLAKIMADNDEQALADP